MKFNPLWWVIFALAGIIILLLIFQPNPPPADTTVLEDEIFKKELRIRQLTALNRFDSTASAQKLAQARDSLKREQNRGVKLASSLQALKSKPTIVKIIQENPAVDSVFQQYDLLLETKDNQISIQSKMIKGLEEENTRITENFLERLQLSQAAFDNQKLIADSYKKDTRKARRAVRAMKVVAVIGTVGGLFLGSQM